MNLWSELVYRITIAPRLKRLKRLLPEAIIYPAGSRYVCSPPVLITDIDFLVYVDGDLSTTYTSLIRARFKETHWKDYFGAGKGDFTAWRRGNVNLIVTSSRKYALAYHTATYICKSRNVRVKYDRIIIHERMRGSMTEEDFFDERGYKWEYDDLKPLFEAVNGPHGHTLHMAYRAQHGLTEVFK